MPADSLVKICCDVIVHRLGIDGPQRLIICDRLLQYALPDEVASRIIFQLPIDELLILEKKWTNRAELFEKAWTKVCQMCAPRSAPLQSALSKSKMEEKTITYPHLYWSFSSEFECPRFCSWTNRNVFLKLYLSELLYLHQYSEGHCFSLHSSNLENNSALTASKGPKKDCQPILQSALGSCKHAISDVMMIDVILNHVPMLTLYPRFLSTMINFLNNYERLENVTQISITKPVTVGCDYNSIFELTKTILNKSPIKTVYLEIAYNAEYISVVKRVLALFASTNNDNVTPCLWTEALTNSPQKLLNCVEYEDIYDFHDMSPSQENVYQITELYIFTNQTMQICFDQHLFDGYFNCWYCLETLSMSLEHNEDLTSSFCDALTVLLTCGNTNLKNVKIEKGIFKMQNLCTLGLNLNETDVEKSVAFEECIFLDTLLGFDADSGLRCRPKNPEIMYSSIGKVSLVATESNWHTEKRCNIQSVVTMLLYYYNPSQLYIFGSPYQKEDAGEHNSIPRLPADKIKLTRLILDQPPPPYEWNSVLELLSDTSCYSSQSIGVHIVCTMFNPAKYKGIFKEMVITNIPELMKTKKADHSFEDYIAQMENCNVGIMIFEATAALGSFFTCMSWGTLLFISSESHAIVTSSCFVFVLIAHILTLVLVAWRRFSIFWRAYFVGAVFLCGIAIIQCGSDTWRAYGLYLCVVGFFHISEYLATALFNPLTLRLDSFLLNHSMAYHIAHFLCVIEYVVWWRINPGIKLHTSFQLVGFSLCIFGEIFRKCAMYTAGVNFTHLIQYRRRQEHVLVTDGIYSVCRHPSYAGWFCWSLATQILTCNPVCFIGYCFVSWKFFDERIYEEELLLINFFHDDYLKYQQKVPSGVPFVQGYRLRYRQ